MILEEYLGKLYSIKQRIELFIQPFMLPYMQNCLIIKALRVKCKQSEPDWRGKHTVKKKVQSL